MCVYICRYIHTFLEELSDCQLINTALQLGLTYCTIQTQHSKTTACGNVLSVCLSVCLSFLKQRIRK